VDDLASLVALSKIFIELSPPDVVEEHMAHIREADGMTPIEEKDPLVNSIVIEGEKSDTEAEAS
jgi:hypothetical protein